MTIETDQLRKIAPKLFVFSLLQLRTLCTKFVFANNPSNYDLRPKFIISVQLQMSLITFFTSVSTAVGLIKMEFLFFPSIESFYQLFVYISLEASPLNPQYNAYFGVLIFTHGYKCTHSK